MTVVFVHEVLHLTYSLFFQRLQLLSTLKTRQTCIDLKQEHLRLKTRGLRRHCDRSDQTSPVAKNVPLHSGRHLLCETGKLLQSLKHNT